MCLAKVSSRCLTKMSFRFAVKTSFGHLEDVLARCLACLNKTSSKHLVDVFLAIGIDVKIENYNHHDVKQLHFYKKVHIKTQSKKKDVIARNEEFQFF